MEKKPDILCLVETRAKSHKAKPILHKFHFNRFVAVEACGYKGGIWCFWDESKITLKVLSYEAQCLHLGVISANKVNWVMSLIYASTDKRERDTLWQSLTDIGQDMNLPWCLIGDYNEVISQVDKRGGRMVGNTVNKELKKMIDRCELMDLGFTGPMYTWSNRRDPENHITERLDRAWSNRDWQLKFPGAMVHHLPRTHSDHHPIWINTVKVNPQRKDYHFRFQLNWFEHRDFVPFVTSNWNHDGNLTEKLSCLTMKMRRWSREVFGNIKLKKTRCLDRIRGIQLALSQNGSNYLKQLEEELVAEYNELLNQEEVFWFQRSKLQWMVNGERNTRFFHLTTIRKQRKRIITRLKDENEIWVEDMGKLRKMAKDFYLSLYTRGQSKPIPEEAIHFPKITGGEAISLNHHITNLEVEQAVFQMGP